jgi:F-type H+-transporting ATPase subunit gamma
VPSIRDIKRRIKSIKNTEQITKAMEMVAAAKMRRAQEAALQTRAYASASLEILKDISSRINPEIHLLLRKNESKKICILLITSDKGLCAGFNTNVLKKALDFAKNKEKESFKIDFVVIGKKGRDFLQKQGFSIIAEFLGIGDEVSILDITPIAQIPVDDFSAKKYREIYLVYTDFVTTLTQTPQIRKLLPLAQENLIKLTEIGKNISPESLTIAKEKLNAYEYIFEPKTDVVLEMMLPRLIEMQIYQAVLESNASEHSARMVAMKNASDNAKDITEDLTLTFNQARQAIITKEITEISAGKAALES